MELREKLGNLSGRIFALKDKIQTEEATKQSLILPFFQMLGYDVFNPLEFCPEFNADYGIKKGEKVDYAIFINEQPIILIEAKNCTEKLEKHSGQLFRYFSTTSSKFGILTNGIKYQFYTDLEEKNKMDTTPFFELDMFNLKDSDLEFLKNFMKESLDADSIFNRASDLKYCNQIRDILKSELEQTSDNFANFFLSQIYDGRKTANAIEMIKPLIKKTLNQFINDTMSDKFTKTLNENKEEPEIQIEVKTNKIYTTEEEIEAYGMIKAFLYEYIDVSRLKFKDTESYFGILLDGNTRKWVCRLFLTENKKSIIFPNKQRIYIDSLQDIMKYKNELLESIEKYDTVNIEAI